MSLQLSTTLRNAIMDLFDTVPGSYQTIVIYNGAMPNDCSLSDSNTVLAVFDLQQPSWDTSFGGAKSLADLPLATTGLATGMATHFRLYDGAAANCHMQGTVSVAGGGGDMIADTVAIAISQPVNILQFTLTAAGA